MLCHLAHQFPGFAAKFLETGQRLRRRFREETVTDLLMSALLTAGGPNLVVEFPDEPVTGADMQWDFVNTDRQTFYRLFIQAKLLYGSGTGWRRYRYKHLLYKSRGRLQAKTLCDSARREVSGYPLYAFYNPERCCALANMAGAQNVEGVNLASGYSIETLIDAASSRADRFACKQLSTLQPHLFSLRALFCPPSLRVAPPLAYRGLSFGPLFVSVVDGRPVFGMPIPPRPEEIRERLVETGLPDVPQVGTQIPSDVINRIARRPDAEMPVRSKLPYWRVTFVSVDFRAESEASE